MRICCIILLAVGSFTSFTFGDDAKQVFESLYGPRLKTVKASVDRADDHALAKELLATAGSSTDTPALLALMCEVSYDLSSKHADGFATAAQAMTLLAETDEAQRTGAREKLVDVLMKQSRLGKADEREAAGDQLIDTLLVMGDEKMEAKKWAEATGDYRRAMTIATPKKSLNLETIKAQLELATRRDRAEKQIARLNEKLLATANDSASAEEIVKLYIVEFDDPMASLPFLNRVKDEQLMKIVPLAAGVVSDLKEGEALELGEWYHGLSKDAADKSVALKRASSYLAVYLSHPTGNELSRKKATLIQSEIAKQIGEGKLDETDKKWVVIFRSSNSRHWNEDVNDTDHFAVKLSNAPPKIRYLRMRRVDTEDMVIIPLASASLGATAEGQFWKWNGVLTQAVNAHQFGIGIKGKEGAPGVAWITNAGRGYGFAHVHTDGGPTWAWAGERTEKITIEISVTTGSLAAKERARLLK